METAPTAADEDSDSDYPSDEDCGLWKKLAPNTDLQVVTWLISDPKHVSRFERSGFSIIKEQHALAKEGLRYFGLLQVANGGNSNEFALTSFSVNVSGRCLSTT